MWECGRGHPSGDSTVQSSEGRPMGRTEKVVVVEGSGCPRGGGPGKNFTLTQRLEIFDGTESTKDKMLEDLEKSITIHRRGIEKPFSPDHKLYNEKKVSMVQTTLTKSICTEKTFRVSNIKSYIVLTEC